MTKQANASTNHGPHQAQVECQGSYDCDSEGHVNITYESGHVDTYFLASEVETAALRDVMAALKLDALPVCRGKGADEIKTGVLFYA